VWIYTPDKQISAKGGNKVSDFVAQGSVQDVQDCVARNTK
jgi:hypothetical protein